MCTAIKYKNFFGRTLDYEKNFGEELVKLNLGSELPFIYEGRRRLRWSIIGTAYKQGENPLFYDGMNERGLCCAALNFPGYAVYRGARCGMLNLASFEVAGYILSCFDSVKEVKQGLRNLNVTCDRSSAELAPTPLHWMVADKEESIVIEPVASGVKIHENELEVLTNSPSFEYHKTRVADFMALSAFQPENKLAPCKDLKIYSRGMGALGLPGDWSSASRFVRAVFVKENIAPQTENEKDTFFEILKSVSVPRGCVKSENGENVGTIYTSCMDMTDFKYYYYKTGDSAMRVLRFR